MGRALLKVRFAGVNFSSSKTVNHAEALIELEKQSQAKGIHLHFLNAYSISLTHSDSKLLEIFNDTDSVCFADGKTIQTLARILRRNHEIKQIRGPSFFESCMASEEIGQLGHYFVGSTEEALKKIVTRCSRTQGFKVMGYESPPFRPLTSADRLELVHRISKSGARIVWLGLGTPKQDYESFLLAKQIPVLAISIGAAFDFYSGSKKQAPTLIQKTNLEWLFRLTMEPRRLWKRYFFGNVIFLWLSIRRKN